MSTTPKRQPNPARALVWPKNWEQLQGAAIAALREGTQVPELEADESGDVPIRYGSAGLWVRVNRGIPQIAIYSCVLLDVEATPALLEALNELNAQHRPATFYLYKSVVVAATELDCAPFNPPALLRALQFLAHLVDEVDEDLSLRFGGRTGLQEARSSGGTGAAPQRAN